MEELTCDNCGSTDIKVEEREGRGITPESVRKKYPNRKISWKGIWNIYTCNKCGNEWKKLIK